MARCGWSCFSKNLADGKRCPVPQASRVVTAIQRTACQRIHGHFEHRSDGYRQSIEELRIVEAGPCFCRVFEPRLELCGIIRADNAKIAQREALQILSRLAKVEIEQKIERRRVRSHNESATLPVVEGILEGYVLDEEVDQL